MCLGTSLGTELVAVGTECGCVILLDTENGLLIMVCTYYYCQTVGLEISDQNTNKVYISCETYAY